MSVLEIAEIPDKLALPPNGGWTTDQLVPLKFSISSALPVPTTAHTSVGEMAVTALSKPDPAGCVWMLQDVPLKNSTSGLPEPLLPTAQTALLDAALTPLR